MKKSFRRAKARPIVESGFDDAIDNTLDELDAARGGDQQTLHTTAKLLRAVLTASQREDDEQKTWS